jgi:cell division protein FtsB
LLVFRGRFGLLSGAMNVDLGIWDKLRRLVLFLLFAAGVLAVIVWYLPLVQHNERMRQDLVRWEGQVRHEEERSRQLDNAIRSLQNNPRTLEKLAREKLGYIKPGETRIQFEPAAPNSR